MSNFGQAEKLPEGSSAGSNNEYKDSQGDRDEDDILVLDGDSESDDPDLGHAEAERITEEKRLQAMQSEADEIERKKIEDEIRRIRDEDREDLESTYRPRKKV